ncbi:MAG: cupin domain-containing protein [Proteobacteria bacterium]|nr:cupin domain-containing protein [Pseudomonadota bacterium]
MADKSKPASTIEVRTGERCYITEFINDPGMPEVSVARCRVEPGVTTQLHHLSVIEWYVVESGHGEMRLGEDPPLRLGPGDTVMIPEGVAQQITNSGGDDLVFLCVCVPRFTSDCYTSLG